MQTTSNRHRTLLGPYWLERGGLEWAGRRVSGPGSSVSRWWPVRHCTLQSSVSRTYSALGAATVAVGCSACPLATAPGWPPTQSGRGVSRRVQAGAPAGLVPLWDRSGTALGPACAAAALLHRPACSWCPGTLLRDLAGGPHKPADLGGRGQKASKSDAAVAKT
jgi:hypothetical protein